MPGPIDRPGPPPEQVRTAIRALLTASSDYQGLDSHTRREIAQGLVKISSTALALAAEADAAAIAARPGRTLARAQSAGSEFSGVAAQRVAGTTQQILNAVSFPRFVTELITGVFKALVDTNQQQMNAYVELIRNVSASVEGFADANVGLDGARRWLVERFPGSFTVEGETDPFDEPGRQLTAEEQAERDAETRLRLRPGAAMPNEGALRVALGLGPQESVPSGDPENLVAMARVALARNRQQMLATMVMLGMQRIVIESGRLHASMRFHIDTRSAAADDRGSTFDLRNEAEASGRFGAGPWGVEAKVKNTIGYVSTQRTQTTEEMNTDLDLNSSVELLFKTDYLPLERLAGQGQVDRIRVNTLNPNEEIRMATEERRARQAAQTQVETARRGQLSIACRPRRHRRRRHRRRRYRRGPQHRPRRPPQRRPRRPAQRRPRRPSQRRPQQRPRPAGDCDDPRPPLRQTLSWSGRAATRKADPLRASLFPVSAGIWRQQPIVPEFKQVRYDQSFAQAWWQDYR
ncbi:MAG: hypothetical protein ACREXJ_00325 [Gammaproteobacteria bacterium]